MPVDLKKNNNNLVVFDEDGSEGENSLMTISSPLPLGFSSTRRQATLFSSPTTKATSPDSSVVTILRTKRCTLPIMLIWFRSLFWSRLSESHHSPLVTPECDSSTSKTASFPVVTVMSQSSRMIRTCSEGEWDDERSEISSVQSFQTSWLWGHMLTQHVTPQSKKQGSSGV